MLSILGKKSVKSPLFRAFAKNKTLKDALDLLPNGGFDHKVVPRDWLAKDFKGCYYLVKSTVLSFLSLFSLLTAQKAENAKGIKYWKGVAQDEGQARRIRGGLKKYWEVLP